MTEILLERTARGLTPTDEAGWKLVNKLHTGTVVVADVKDPSRRSGDQHRFFFALVTLLYQNQSHFKNVDTFRKCLLIKLGRCDVYKFQDGTTAVIPHSLKFGKVTADEFSVLVNELLDFAVSIGWDRDALLAETKDYCGVAA